MNPLLFYIIMSIGVYQAVSGSNLRTRFDNDQQVYSEELDGAVAAGADQTLVSSQPEETLNADERFQSTFGSSSPAMELDEENPFIHAEDARYVADMDVDIDAAKDQVSEAARESGARIGAVANKIGQHAREAASAAGKSVAKLGKAAAQGVLDAGKHVWENREVYINKAKDVAKEVTQFAAAHKAELTAIGKAMASRLKAASGSSPVASMTDIEFCTGCQLVLSSVIEHTRESSSLDDIVYVIHSACTDQAPVFQEMCHALVRIDTLAAQELQVSRDADFVCESLGMCYAGIDKPSNP